VMIVRIIAVFFGFPTRRGHNLTRFQINNVMTTSAEKTERDNT